MGMEHLLDVRNLELPEPLLRALGELESLSPGDYLRMLSHRDPVLLYPMLAAQGFSHSRQQDPGGIHEILIWRSGDVAAEQAVRDRTGSTAGKAGPPA
jgi:TusA-related sulfurtransferase